MAEIAASASRLTGRTVWLWGDHMAFRVSGADTGGAYSVLDYMMAPGSGSGTHLHNNEDESFYVLEGALTFQIEDQRVEVPSGSFVKIPRGARHSFANAVDGTTRALIILTPAGLEGFFEELGRMAEANPAGPPPRDEFLALAERYNLVF